MSNTTEGLQENPNRDELESNTIMASEILKYQAQGYKVDVDELSGTCTIWKNEKSQTIGQISTMTQLTTHLYGGQNPPKMIEIKLVGDVGLVEYENVIVGCGYVDEEFRRSNQTQYEELASAAAEVLGSRTMSIISFVAEHNADNSGNEMLSTSISTANLILSIVNTATMGATTEFGEVVSDYSQDIGVIGSVADWNGSSPLHSDVISDFAERGICADFARILETLAVDLALGYNVQLGNSWDDPNDVVIYWDDGEVHADSGKSVNIDAYKNIPMSTYIEAVLKEYGDRFSEEERAVLERLAEDETLKTVDDLLAAFAKREKEMEKSETVVFTASPLIFDLDGNGYDIETVENGAYFDLNNNQFREKINWSTKDAFLALDLDGDGVIENGGELFGNYTLLKSGEYAKNGFEALAQHDVNGDGMITADDEIFSDLRVWLDADGDGISGNGELSTLSEAGVKEIHLDYTDEVLQVNEEAFIDGRATFVWEDGSEGEIGDLWVTTHAYNTVDTTEVEISDEIKELPNVRSFGNMHSLQIAMALDETGQLKELVKSFITSHNGNEKKEILETMLYFMCDAVETDNKSRGGFIDAKNLLVIEKIMGRSFNGQNGANPNPLAANILKPLYQELFDMYYSEMALQTSLKNYKCLLMYEEDDRGKTYANTEFFNRLMTQFAKEGVDKQEVLEDMAIYMKHLNNCGVEGYIDFRVYYLTKPLEAAIISAMTNDDLLAKGISPLVGTTHNDVIVGDSENNTLMGQGGNDAFLGGKGNDKLQGGTGNDVYIINMGDGQDTISDGENGINADKIVFGEGISKENVQLERVGYNLVIKYGEGDTITVQSAYRSQAAGQEGQYFVENIEFADGTVWDTAAIAEHAKVRRGTDEADVMSGYASTVGYSQDETFMAGTGDDTINAYNGDDMLYGEAGNDTLQGGIGDDTYIFNLGDGQDTVFDGESGTNVDKIVFGEGISKENVQLERVGYNLVIKYGEGDTITVQSAYRSQAAGQEGQYFVENIEFADGTVWDTAAIAEHAKVRRGTDEADTMSGCASTVGYSQDETFMTGAGNDMIHASGGNDTLYGEAGNDILSGENGNDILIGGTGNDTLQGGIDNDIYVFNLGDGQDTISDGENGINADKIVFGEGISKENVKLERVGYNLVIKYGEGDTITIQNAYRSQAAGQEGQYFVENIEFADGTVWDTATIAEHAKIKKGTDEADVMSGYTSTVGYSQDETFMAGAGNDMIHASGGNDTLYGEAGNDILSGENGNDILIGGTGNDTLRGGMNNDTYVFNLGDGQDTVFDSENGISADKIVFGTGISQEDVILERVEKNLVIKYGEEDCVTIQNAYYYYNASQQGYQFIENIEFADGTVWDTATIAEHAKIKKGTDEADVMSGYASTVGYSQDETFMAGAGNDTINAFDGDDTLYGEEGNDRLYGNNGDDVLIGGSGEDILIGGAGNDTYIIGAKDGNDTIDAYDNSTSRDDKIVFGEGIKVEELELSRIQNHLNISNSKSGQVTTIGNAYANVNYQLNIIEFADGVKATVDYDNMKLVWEPSVQEELIVEADSIAQEEPIVEENPVVQEEPIVEADLVIQEEPAVEADLMDEETTVVTDEIEVFGVEPTTDDIVSSSVMAMEATLGKGTVSSNPIEELTTQSELSITEPVEEASESVVNSETTIAAQLMVESLVEPSTQNGIGDTEIVVQDSANTETVQLWAS